VIWSATMLCAESAEDSGHYSTLQTAARQRPL
jgi:hypothetical protein